MLPARLPRSHGLAAMTDRRDIDFRDDPLTAPENQSVRRTVADVNEINEDRRFWQRVRRQGQGALAWLLAAPVAIAGAWQGGIFIAGQIARWIGKSQ